MARDTDFLELYEALDLSPDASPDAFRQAYRRRVAELHPDRAASDPADLGQLQRLNALYASALEFQRRHGRLPGAAAPSPSRPAPSAAAAAPAAATSALPPRARPPAAAPPRTGVLFGAIALAVVAAAIALGAFDDAPPSPAPRPLEAVRPAAPQASVERRVERRVELGTHKDAVRALLGAPLLETENRWDYGPSWITFRCEVVNGWYSSPLRPLGTPSAHPGESTMPPPRC